MRQFWKMKFPFFPYWVKNRKFVRIEVGGIRGYPCTRLVNVEVTGYRTFPRGSARPSELVVWYTLRSLPTVADIKSPSAQIKELSQVE